MRIDEFALQRSHGGLCAALEAMGDVVWRAALPSGDLAYVSPGIETLTGYPVGRFRHLRDLLEGLALPEDRERLAGTLPHVVARGRLDVRYRFGHADATTSWLRCRAVVQAADGRGGQEVVGVLGDITAECSMLQRVRDDARLYRRVLEDIPAPVVRLNRDLTISYANRPAAARWGREAADVIGRSMLDFADPGVQPLVRGAHDKAMAASGPIIHDVGEQRDADRTRWNRWIVQAVVDADGEVVGTQGCAHDLSDLKQLEVELREANERFELAASCTGDGILDIDQDSGRAWYSSRWKEILGYADHELPGTPDVWRRLIHPDDRPRAEARLAEYLADPVGVLREEVRYRHKDGHTVHVVNRLVARVGTGRRPGRLVGAMTDVTAEISSEHRLRDAIESLSDGFAWFDADDRMVLHNRRYVETAPYLAGRGDLTGHTFAELVRWSLDAIADMPDPDAYLTRRLAMHRRGETFEVRFRDGGWRRTASCRTDHGGTVIIVSDITDLKRAEQRLSDAIESMQEGFMLVGPDLRLVMANRRCREMYPVSGHLLEPGVPFEDFLRYGVRHGQYADAVGREEEYIADTIASWSEASSRAERRLDADRWVLMSQRRAADGSLVAIRTELTAQKAREAELERARDQLVDQTSRLSELTKALEAARIEAVDASRTKSNFLAHMSHELRTPLNAILGFSEVIRDELFGPAGSTTAYRDYAGTIHEAGTLLLDLIGDILDLAKVESGRAGLEVEAIAPDRLAENCLRLMRGLAGQRRVRVSASVDADCSAVHADQRAVKQIVINLMSNAIKFTPSGGSVDLSIGCAGEEIRIAVSDTGIGMTADEVAEALEVFGQIDSKLARESHGTGLGLPLVKALAEAHGGRLEIRSTPGVGTVASVYLPPRG